MGKEIEIKKVSLPSTVTVSFLDDSKTYSQDELFVQALNIDQQQQDNNKALGEVLSELTEAISYDKKISGKSLGVMRGQIIDKAMLLNKKDKDKLFKDLGWSKDLRLESFYMFQAYMAHDKKMPEKMPETSGIYRIITTFTNSDEYRAYSKYFLNKVIPAKNKEAFHKHTLGAIEYILSAGEIKELGDITRDKLKEFTQQLKISLNVINREYEKEQEEIERKIQEENPEDDKNPEEKKEVDMHIKIQVDVELHNTAIFNGYPRYAYTTKNGFTPQYSTIEQIGEHGDVNFYNYVADNHDIDIDLVSPMTKTEVNNANSTLSKSIGEDYVVWDEIYKAMIKEFHPDPIQDAEKKKEYGQKTALINKLGEVIKMTERFTNNKQRSRKAIADFYREYTLDFDEDFFVFLESASNVNSFSGSMYLDSDEYKEYRLAFVEYKKLLNKLEDK